MARSTLAIACGIIGSVVGYLGFVFLLERGFYAIVLPGGLCGLAAGIVKTRTVIVACVSATIALVAGLIAEHRFAPFVADTSLGYFFRHTLSLNTTALVLIGLGGLIGFWVPFRRRY